MKYLYNFEIDVSDQTCDDYAPRWANYGTIIAQGNSLEELLDNATIDIMDQDGGELNVRPADAAWMQEVIKVKFLNDPDREAARIQRLRKYDEMLFDAMAKEDGNG